MRASPTAATLRKPLSDSPEAHAADVAPSPASFGLGRLFWRIREAVVVAEAATGRILLWNPAAEAMFGYTAAEARSLRVDVLVPESLRARHWVGLARYAATGHGPLIDAGTPVQLPARHKDGSELVVELSLSAVEDAALPGRFVLAVIRDVTARVRVEAAALQVAEARFHQTFAHAPLSVQLLAPDGRTLQVNRAWETLWGVTLAHLGDYNILHDPQLAAKGVLPYLERAIAGEPVAIPAIKYEPAQTQLIAGAVPFRWVRAVAFPVTDDRGAVREVVLIHEDITERLQAEEALAERARLAALGAAVGSALTRGDTLPAMLQGCAEALVAQLDAAFARIWTLDEAARELELQASAGLYTHLDGPHGRVPVGSLKIGLIAQERRPHLTNDVVGDPRVSDQAWAAREGMVAFAGYPLLVGERLVGVMALFARHPLTDATLEAMATVADSIALGIERARAEAALRASRDELAFLAEASGALSASLDYETTLASIARLAVPTLADWCAVDILDEDGALRRLAVAHVDPAKVAWAEELQRRYPPDRDAAVGVPQVLRTGVAAFFPEIPDALLAAAARDGAHLALLRSVGLRAALIVPLIAGGRTLGALSFVRAESGRRYGPEDLRLAEDVARRAGLAVDNARLYRDAQEALRVRDEFLAAVSHDLRTPLSTIAGMTQLVARQARRLATADGERIAERLATVDHAARRMTAMVDQLLDVTRLESGRPLDLAPESLDLLRLLRQLAEDHQRGAPRHALRVESDCAELVGQWDKGRLERVFSNLLGNAVKYSPEGGPVVVSVGLAQDPDGAWAVVRVQDAGLGIPAEELPRIFERYYRASNVAGHIKGVGIGLAGAKQIVEQHGGTMAVASTAGAGTTVTVRLPLVHSAEGDE